MKKKLLFLSLGLAMASQVINAQIPNYVPNNGLVSWWGFNGNANDSSVNAKNGTVAGATLTNDRFGNPNGAYLFTSDVASTITLPLANNLTTSFSILTWVKPTTTVSVQPESNVCPYGVSVSMAYSKQNWAISPFQVNNPDIGAGGLSIGTNGVMTTKYGINILDVRQNYTGTLTDYTCIVQAYDANYTYLYVNGVLISTKAVDCAPAKIILSTNLQIGGSLYSANFSGIVDEVGVWNRALTQDEVTALYNSVTTLPSSNSIDKKTIITVAPNPAHNHITIHCDNKADVSGWSVKIYDGLGNQVYYEMLNTQIHNIQYPTSNGLYIVKVYDQNNLEVDSEKVIVQ